MDFHRNECIKPQCVKFRKALEKSKQEAAEANKKYQIIEHLHQECLQIQDELERRCELAEAQATKALQQLALERKNAAAIQDALSRYEKVAAESSWKYTVAEVKLQETEDKLHESEGKLLETELKLQECAKQLDELKLRCNRAEAQATEASAALQFSLQKSHAEILGLAETKVEKFAKSQEDMFVELKKLITQELENTKQLAVTLDTKLDEFGAQYLHQEQNTLDPKEGHHRSWFGRSLLGCK